MSHFVSPTHHIQLNFWEPWAKAMEEDSNGAFDVEIYPAQALGRSAEHFDMAVTGIAEVTQAVPAYTKGRFPLSSVVELPFLHPNAVIAHEIMTELYPKYFKDEFKEVKVLWIGPTSVYHVFTTGDCVRTVDDFKGLKLRNPGGVMTDVLKMLEASPVTIAAGDLYTSVERGVVEGVVLSYASIQDYGLDKLLKCGTELGLGSPSLVGAMNWDFYNGLPPDLQKVVDDISVRMGGGGENWLGHSYDDGDKKAFDWFQEIGMELITFTPEERAKLTDAVSGVYQKWLDDMAEKGLPGREVLDAYLAALAERGVNVTLPIN
jgi:TRAP-type C4-dicarboxylate transport system substrate-binding protein